MKSKIPMTLTHNMQVALNRYALGGVNMMRTDIYTVSCQTMNALVKQGYMGRDGMTVLGQQTANLEGPLF